jgi:Kdo2-lipid IVA lauroyltransferase/acyltransferase
LGSTSPTGSTARTKRLPPKKRAIKLLGRVTFRVLSASAGLLCPWSVRVIGNCLGSAFYRCSKRYRDVALKNLRAAYADEMSEAEIESTAREVFRHFAREALQFFYVLSLSREQIDAAVELVGIEHLDGALAHGNGCVVITAHYGNWEMLARKLVISGYKANVIARDSDDPGITGITTRIRESGGYRVFDKDQPIIGAYRALKSNEILGILPDQNDFGGISADFFGRPALTAPGPAVLALKSGAPIVPMFCERVADGKYRATAYPALVFEPTGQGEADIAELTRMVNAAIETEVRRNPSQWLWLHDRWKLPPEAKNAAD